MLPSGRTFYKMSGSGNDFVMVDAINHDFQDLLAPERVQALCSRGTGVGADGLVLLERSWAADFRMGGTSPRPRSEAERLRRPVRRGGR